MSLKKDKKKTLTRTRNKERASQYWICGDCAHKKGWVMPTYPVTCTSGLCGHCDRPDSIYLIPTVDFTKNGVEPLWD